MAWFRFGKSLRDLSYLDKKLSTENIKTRIIDLRKKYKMAVIDDKPFTQIDHLKRNEYDITYFLDLDRIEQISNYNIVLCDLSGVGLNLNPHMQGAHIISEIKRSYPEKYVLAYTGEGYSDIYEKSANIADVVLKKDVPITEWCQALDDAIQALSNPSKVWRGLRFRLLTAGVTPYQLAILEDLYVSSVVDGEADVDRILFKKAEKLKLSGDVRGIMQSVIGSLLYEALKAWLSGGAR